MTSIPFLIWLSVAFPIAPITKRNDNIVLYYGFDASEPSRVSWRRRILGEKGYEVEFPLSEWTRTIFHTEEVGIQTNAHYGILNITIAGLPTLDANTGLSFFVEDPIFGRRLNRLKLQLDIQLSKGIALHELEPHIQADEKLHPNTFWSRVAKTLGAKDESPGYELQLDLLDFVC